MSTAHIEGPKAWELQEVEDKKLNEESMMNVAKVISPLLTAVETRLNNLTVDKLNENARLRVQLTCPLARIDQELKDLGQDSLNTGDIGASMKVFFREAAKLGMIKEGTKAEDYTVLQLLKDLKGALSSLSVERLRGLMVDRFFSSDRLISIGDLLNELVVNLEKLISKL